jgi:RNA polymerase sigma-70 factor, ECF subfamily
LRIPQISKSFKPAEWAKPVCVFPGVLFSPYVIIIGLMRYEIEANGYMAIAGNFMNAQPIAMTSPVEFAELYESHYAAVYRTALRITGSAADAEDVLQTVFLRILDRSEGPDWQKMPESYFRRAASNAAIDLLRRRTAHSEVQITDSLRSAASESSTFLKEQLRRAIATLEPNDALLFLLRFVEGFSNGELAEMFDQEKNNIAVRLHRIRQALQAEMER